MTRQKGQSVAYSYDNLHRLTTLNVGGQVYTYGYAGASPLVQSLTRPNGAVTTYQYDTLNRLTQATTQVGGVTISQYAYPYNQQDLRASETAVEPEPMTPYTDELVNYAYNNLNELTTISDPGQKTLVYDASGNLTQGYTPEGYVFTATYDGLNRLGTLSYTDGGGVVNRTDFFYLGNLLLKKKRFQNSSLTQESRYVYDGMLPVQERDGNNNVAREYTYGLNLGGGIGGLLHLNQGGAPYSYTYDGKGNVTALLDGVGNVAAVYQYDPFGVPRGPANPLSQPMQFSTKPYDEKTGLSYYGYRFYAPVLGRWLTRDPIGEAGGINLYAFVANDPINKLDLDGLLTICNGRWNRVKWIAGIHHTDCTCYWRCIPWDNPPMLCDPDWTKLPRTPGKRYGGGCLCFQKPGPEIGGPPRDPGLPPGLHSIPRDPGLWTEP